MYRLFLCVVCWFVVVPANANNLLVLGDSLSAAYGIEVEQGWVALLQKKLQSEGRDIQVVNASISGETTAGGVSRLPALLDTYNPKWVLIELGANDGLRGLPLDLAKQNLAALIEASQAKQAKVMLLGMRIPPNYGPTYSRRFYAMYGDLAKTYQTDLVPFLLQDVALRPDLIQDDQLHPTAQAQPFLLDQVWRRLQPFLSQTRAPESTP
ncbi:MAG: arylesterase [Pontibacterium sp.]